MLGRLLWPLHLSEFSKQRTLSLDPPHLRDSCSRFEGDGWEVGAGSLVSGVRSLKAGEDRPVPSLPLALLRASNGRYLTCAVEIWATSSGRTQASLSQLFVPRACSHKASDSYAILADRMYLRLVGNCAPQLHSCTRKLYQKREGCSVLKGCPLIMLQGAYASPDLVWTGIRVTERVLR